MEFTRRTPARTTAAFLVLALAFPFTLAEEPQAPLKGTGRLAGRVLRADGKTAVENAVVRACYLQNGASLASSPTGAKGEFLVDELPSGYADVAIETPDGVFVANQVLQFLPGKKDAVDFVLTRYTEKPAEWWAGQEKRQVPCATGDSTGTADIRASSGGGGFFRSAPGIAVLTGASVALIVLAASGGGSDEAPASPSQP